MMRWNLNSNACDVLSLGPGTAGRLATVGIRSVAELLAAKPQAVVQRLREEELSSGTLRTWQCEARLVLELPDLPPDTARLLAAAEIGTVERIGLCTPTELLAALETAKQRGNNRWLTEKQLPTVGEVGEWIILAQQVKKSFAA